MTTPATPADIAGLIPHAASLLLALDFDGTLAHLVDNPDDARMTYASRLALDGLSGHPQTTIALVSGRGARNLSEVSSPDPRWWLVGSHGVEIIAPGQAITSGFDDDFLRKRQLLWDGFSEVARRFPGVWVEEKTFGAALHTRGVSAEVEAEAHDATWLVIRGFDGLTTRTGHGILESSLGHQTKGDGIDAVKVLVKPDITVFVGDDVTDEDGFRVLDSGDIGIKVGHGQTLAGHRLDNPDAVAEFLKAIARARGV